MDLSQLLGWLAIAAGSAVGGFVIMVALDDVAGVALAVKAGKFDWNKLPAFLESEFGTRQALALFGLVLTASVTAAGAALQGGLTKEALHVIADAALAAATVGAGAMFASVLSDLVDKVKKLIGG